MCGSVSGGRVCYSGDSVGSVAVYFCDDGYTLQGDSTRECLSILASGMDPLLSALSQMVGPLAILLVLEYTVFPFST